MVDKAPGDWTSVGTAVELALAQRRAADLSGALDSASRARALAEANVDWVASSLMPPEVASWSLAHLIPLEVEFGDAGAARRVFDRCLGLWKQPVPANVHASWKNSRVTSVISLTKAYDRVGWHDEALVFLVDSNERLKRQLRSITQAAQTPSARELLAPLTPVDRLAMVLDVIEDATRG